MPEAVVVGLGVVLVLGVFVDALATTLAVSEGAGPVTRRVAGVMWRGLLRLHRRDSSGSTALAVAGAAVLIGTVVLWVLGLWAGWSLIFLAGDGAVVQSTTGVVATVVDVVYYVGFTVFTLGVGDYVAGNGLYRVLTAVAAFTGLFLVTLAITYLISVVSAVVARRAVAVHIMALGSSAGQIAVRGWDGTAFSSAYAQHLLNLTGELATVAEQHLAYPVLHYFHSRTRDTAAPVAVAQLDDALLILAAGVDPGARLDPGTVGPARNVIGRYLTTAGATSSMPAAPEPPRPDLGVLRTAGIPLVAPETFALEVDAQSDRRRALARLVSSDGWSW